MLRTPWCGQYAGGIRKMTDETRPGLRVCVRRLLVRDCHRLLGVDNSSGAPLLNRQLAPGS